MLKKLTRNLIILFLQFPLVITAQQKIKVAGSIYNLSNASPIPGVTVNFREKSLKASESGQFEIVTGSGMVSLTLSHVNFQPKTVTLLVTRDTAVSIYMEPRAVTMNAVKVIGSTQRRMSKDINANTIYLSKKDIGSLPDFLGEHDPVKALQYTPGIGKGGEGNPGLFIRGGTSGQNLTLMDDATIFNPSHLLGFFSVFNTAAISDLKAYKSGIPAEYGGRLSAVMAVNTSRKIADSLSAEGSVGLVSGNLSITAPLNPNWSVSASIRKTFLGLTVWPVMNQLNSRSSFLNNMNYDFYDLNLNSNARLSKRDFLHFSVYHGSDDFGFRIVNFNIRNRMDWQNSAASLGWNHLLSNRLSLSSAITASGYNFSLDNKQDKYNSSLLSNLQDYGVKSHVDYAAGRHKIKGGMQYTYHNFKPNSQSTGSGSTALDFGEAPLYHTAEASLFASDEITVSDRLSLYAGGRYTLYKQLSAPAQATNQASASAGGRNGDFWYFEPRILLRYSLGKEASIKASFTKNVQPIHLISITAVNFPTDFWMPSVKGLPPERGNQFSTGYFRDFAEGQFEAYVDLYYKNMNGLVEFSGGLMNVLNNVKIEDTMLFGKGYSYGSEFYLRKKSGLLTGWLSYTLAKTDRKFPAINDGKTFPFKYDRRHDVSATANLNTGRWTFSSSFTYATGSAYTQPVSRYFISGNIINEYGPYNGTRMPAYHRLDLGATCNIRETSKVSSSLTFSVYNVYSRQNPIYIYFLPKGDLDKQQLTIQPKSISLLPVLPSVSWSFKFK